MKCRNRHSIFTLVLLICAAIVAFGLWTAAIAETPQWPKQEDGCYLIATSSDLAKFRDAVNGGSADISAKLTADIDLEGSETNQWDPIGTTSIDKGDRCCG